MLAKVKDMTREEHLLVILSEECNEVGQRASKALRFGLDEIQAGQHLTNAERITQEMNDLIGVFQMLVNEINVPEINPRKVDDKKYRIEKWLKYSDTNGKLSVG
jgi:hypothetical protein